MYVKIMALYGKASLQNPEFKNNPENVHTHEIFRAVVDQCTYSLCHNVRPKIYQPRHEISKNVVCATCKGSDQPAQTRSLIRAFASCLNIL